MRNMETLMSQNYYVAAIKAEVPPLAAVTPLVNTHVSAKVSCEPAPKVPPQEETQEKGDKDDEIEEEDDNADVHEDVHGNIPTDDSGQNIAHPDVQTDAPASSAPERIEDSHQDNEEAVSTKVVEAIERENVLPADENIALSSLRAEKLKKKKSTARKKASSTKEGGDQSNKKRKINTSPVSAKKQPKKSVPMSRHLVEESSSADEDEALKTVPLKPSKRKYFGGQKLPLNVPTGPLDNISFHHEDGARK